MHGSNKRSVLSDLINPLDAALMAKWHVSKAFI